jgi:hypothetical protein
MLVERFGCEVDVQDARSRKARNASGKPVSTGTALDEIVMEDARRDHEDVAFV